MKNYPINIGDKTIQPGERVTIGLPTPEFYSYASMYMPIHIIHGKKKGPCLIICAAIHGDEINGIAILHRLLNLRLLKSIQGTLIAVPVVNVYGLISLTRNLPDRRDLDGSFPGYERGSFAARLAHHFTKEILSKATHCIDIHSSEPHHMKMPQIQTNFDQPEPAKLARAFQAPIMIHTESSRGLLWQNYTDYNIPTIIYEAGEVLRMDETAIRTGLRGIIRVMRSLNILNWKDKGAKVYAPPLIRSSRWIRSPGSGICQLVKKLGSHIKKGDVIANIFDPFGTEKKYQIISPYHGMIIGKNSLSLVNEGDNIYQITEISKEVSSQVGLWNDAEIKEEV